jgi:hypothetical protein
LEELRAKILLFCKRYQSIAAMIDPEENTACFKIMRSIDGHVSLLEAEFWKLPLKAEGNGDWYLV